MFFKNNLTKLSSGPALALTLLTAIALSACGGGDDDPAPLANQLYTQTNETANAIVHFTRTQDGKLLRQESVATGGAGTNGVDGTGAVAPDSLASQHSVVLSVDGTTLYVVNAGDDSISVMAIDQTSGAPTLKKKTSTAAGHRPNSVAVSSDGYLYATFLGGTTQLASYKIQADGGLTQVAVYDLASLGSVTTPVAPTQVVTSPDGAFVVVSAGPGSNAVFSFPVVTNGNLGTPVVLKTQFITPFAGAFRPKSATPVYLSTGISAMSLASYNFFPTGNMTQLSIAAATGVVAPCWLSIDSSGKFAFVGNASGAISSYSIGAGATLTLLNSSAASEPPSGAGVNPVAGDSWISADNQFLYSTYLGNDKIVVYAIGATGTLTKLSEVVVGTSSGLSLQGLAGI